MHKLMNNNDNSNSISKGKILINNIFQDSNSQVLNNNYFDYPLNLLVEVNQIINIEILFLTIIFNIFIVNKLINIDYNKYLPKNKIGKSSRDY